MTRLGGVTGVAPELWVRTTHIYRRLFEALDGDDIAQSISNLFTELAVDFHKDTGVKIGVALGWDKPREVTTWVTMEDGITMPLDALMAMQLGSVAEYVHEEISEGDESKPEVIATLLKLDRLANSWVAELKEEATDG
jgi:hypothetical protein